MPFKKYCVKGRDNPSLLHERDVTWARARHSNLQSDWLYFRQSRNRCTTMTRKAKSDYFLNETTCNLNKPKKFWKHTDSISGAKKTSVVHNEQYHKNHCNTFAQS